jgi:mRNA deadenylase 3'-5' endonuclease subunit Ccr4
MREINCSFRVVSYNILADVYAETEAAKTELFPYCPSYAMALDYRKQLYLKEILGNPFNFISIGVNIDEFGLR